jgi:hypothetical protein
LIRIKYSTNSDSTTADIVEDMIKTTHDFKEKVNIRIKKLKNSKTSKQYDQCRISAYLFCNFSETFVKRDAELKKDIR